jgi:hypothetical protein
MHAEQFKIVNVENNEELASVGSWKILKTPTALQETAGRF